MRTPRDTHGTEREAYAIADALVKLGQRRMNDDDGLSLDEANKLAEVLGEEAAGRLKDLGREGLMELTHNLRESMDYRFAIGDDIFDIEEASHISIAFLAWSNGFGVPHTQIELVVQFVECSVSHVLPRALRTRQGQALLTQCRTLVDSVARRVGAREPYRTWCNQYGERLYLMA